MSNRKERLSPEQLAAVKDAIKNLTDINFDKMVAAYKELNADQPDLTEEDLIAEIIIQSGYEAEMMEDPSFDEAIAISATVLGEVLGVL